MPIIPGGTVTFDLTVYNQGTLDAYNIQLSDYTPTGLTLSDPLWVDGGGTQVNLVTPIGFLGAGQSTVVTINYTVDSDFMSTSITNNAEIESQEDINGPRADDDSTAGDNEGDAPDDNDNDIDETNGEDDYDPETITIDMVDYALRKTTPSFGAFLPGDVIPFDITLFNQGTVDASEIVVFDHVPAGLDFIDDPILNEGWSEVNSSLLSFTHDEILVSGDSVVIRVYMTPNGSDLTLEGLTNIAEIGAVQDLSGTDISSFDVDSTPDDEIDNDEGGDIGQDTDDTVDNEGGDEDDADPEAICAMILTCPADINGASCFVEPFATAAEAGLESGCDNLDLEFSFDDEVVPADCISGGDFFSERTVIRTYRYTSSEGDFDLSCPQEITYEFTECNQVVDAGRIEIIDSPLLLVPTGCQAPPITEMSSATVSGCNDQVEYMWLVSTEERSNGSPFIPNPLNVGPEGSGSVWEIINGATDADYQPGIISQNTYYVRCTRSISCCEFVETNLVGYRIDETADCPEVELLTPETGAADCEEDIILNAIDDNMINGETLEFRTNQTIEASNKLGNNAHIIYNAKKGTTLNQGFEVQSNAQLDVKTDGCND